MWQEGEGEQHWGYWENQRGMLYHRSFWALLLLPQYSLEIDEDTCITVSASYAPGPLSLNLKRNTSGILWFKQF